MSIRVRAARLDDRLRRRAGAEILVGLDEVGRGCLAGPVVVAAVALPPGISLPAVRDSKTLSLAQREHAYLLIRDAALIWAALAISPREVDELNVLRASLEGMRRLLVRIRDTGRGPVDLALVDGHLLPPNMDCAALALVKGDGRSQSIAAASIVAKVLRDRVMRSWARRFPHYGFERNVGYPTPEHRQGLRTYGPCWLHRRSFAPVAEAQKQMRFSI